MGRSQGKVASRRYRQERQQTVLQTGVAPGLSTADRTVDYLAQRRMCALVQPGPAAMVIVDERRTIETANSAAVE